MTEDDVAQISDNYNDADLPMRSKLALRFADAFLHAEGPPDAATIEALNTEFTPAEIAEMGIGLALFHGFSKLLIVTGCEPAEMETTILSAPGSASK